MRRLTIPILLVVSGGLTLSCDSQSVPVEPTGSLNRSSKVGVTTTSAVVSRGPVGFALVATDFENGLTALVTSGPSVLENCGSAEFSEQTDFLEVVRPNGALHRRLLGRNLSIGVWLEPLADVCSVPHAVGRATATLVDNDPTRIGPGVKVLSWHARGSLTAIESGQRYRLVITAHQTIHQDGTISGNRSDIRLIPVGH
jgi:hypothetical protein